ncbi:aminotransferase class I/II-fold pyridoxal phosphate-dependent enzyme [Clostridium sardiniense]|uniref:Aminotransferase n=1 Tax=Clostridium sardiniense TaxID=29369 RepID=A0ABS7KW19_CLOSR|nr:aminotransferase class I/II-fold pyridoxal phosphate-dependent enzyme [Clostridium sardiniense]MBY0754909.1 aminotransferase class I/II-fold pyridoxal phosphate-dependent enzyme [Clostridium sardiniense]MDQ0461845.1 aminotransferase [Clostridium sardiniense]
MNNRVMAVEISGIRKFYNKVRKVEGAISLTLGQPDFNTPIAIKNGIKKAIDENKTVYTENAGVKELRSEISNYLRTLGVNYSEEEICITIGGSEAILDCFMALLNEGDKVLIPTPAYPAYESVVNIVGGKIINYKLNEDFTVNVDNIKEKFKKEGCKYLVLSFPTNPTGAVLDKKGRDELIDFIKSEDIVVITDEIYASIIYDDYYSVAQESSIKEKVIYISGFSKMFSATGLRIGYIACHDTIMKEIMKVHQYGVSCATSIVQYGMIEGLKYSMNDVIYMRDEFLNRKNYVVGRLRQIGFHVSEPRGAFYVFPSIKKFNLTSEEFCERLLNEKKVACVPGSAFGDGGEGFIRISYCYSIEELELALNKIEEFIKNL